MDTRAVHQHLKKKGWSLTRTSGGHDVYTHPEAKNHIAVPRHKQLKAPLVKGILKQSEVRERLEEDATSRAKDIAKMAARRNAGLKEQSEPEDSLEKNDTPAKRSLSKAAGMVKDLAKNAKATKKEKPDTFQPEPELSSQIVKV
jgi:predicted RNA binding protein YcfA (HicA-like mRNA interferase family)